MGKHSCAGIACIVQPAPLSLLSVQGSKPKFASDNHRTRADVQTYLGRILNLQQKVALWHRITPYSSGRRQALGHLGSLCPTNSLIQRAASGSRV
jgi:hypothetical protein